MVRKKFKKRKTQKGEGWGFPSHIVKQALQPVTPGISAASNLGKIKKIQEFRDLKINLPSGKQTKIQQAVTMWNSDYKNKEHSPMTRLG